MVIRNIVLEELFAVDHAIDYVLKKDSTDEDDIEAVKDYEEYVEELKEKKEEEEDSSSFDAVDEEEGASEDDTAEDQTEADDSEGDAEDSASGDSEQSEEAEEESPVDEKPSEESIAYDTALEELQAHIDNYNTVAALYEKTQAMIERGKVVGSSLEDYAGDWDNIKKVYKLDISASGMFEVVTSVESYTAHRKALNASLEDFKTALVRIGEYIIASLKFLAQWIVDYFYYDPSQENNFTRKTSIRINKAQDMVLKLRRLSQLEATARTNLSSQQYRARANMLITEDRNMSIDEIVDALKAYSRVIASYWAQADRFISSTAFDVLNTTDALLSSNINMDNATYVNVSKTDLRNINVEKVTGDKATYYSGHNLDPKFSVFITKDVLPGRVRLVFMLPEYGLTYEEALETDPKNYAITIKRDANSANSRHGIFYGADMAMIKAGLEVIVAQQPVNKHIYATMKRFAAQLNNAANKMKRDLNQIARQSDLGDVSERREIQRLSKFNINVLSNFVVRPLKATLDYNNRVKRAYTNLFDSNYTLLNSIIAQYEQQREDLRG